MLELRPTAIVPRLSEKCLLSSCSRLKVKRGGAGVLLPENVSTDEGTFFLPLYLGRKSSDSKRRKAVGGAHGVR